MRFNLLFLSLYLTGCGVESDLQLFSSRTKHQRTIPQIIAHRGYQKRAPENTLSAFQKAVDVKSDLVELDYHHTSDGLPVVLHDNSLKRTTNALQLWGQNPKVTKVDSRRLGALDAGSWFAPSFAGERIPTLEESLDLIQGSGTTTLIERKNGDAASCLKLLELKGYTHRVVIQSFDWDYLREVEKLKPSVETAALGKGKLTAEVIAELVALGVSTASWNHHNLDLESVNALHRVGLKVYAYTVNSSTDVLRMRDIGADAIITDDPLRTRAILSENK